MTKSEIRSRMMQMRNELTAEEVFTQSQSIFNRLVQSSDFKECNSILSYVSFGKEIDTENFLRKELEGVHKDAIYIPKVEGKIMNFYRLTSFDELVRSSYGILEPIGDKNHQYNPKKGEKTLMIVPGLAFDSDGNRIGYGGGFYDRFLSSYDNQNLIKVACAYDFQILDQLETNDYDCRVDYIITPTRIILCNMKGGAI